MHVLLRWHSGGSSGTTSISTGGSGGMTSGSIDTRGYMADIKGEW